MLQGQRDRVCRRDDLVLSKHQFPQIIVDTTTSGVPMAIVSPSMLAPLRTDAGRFRELDVLGRLRDHLPAQFEVFHSIGLHSLDGERDRYGEIDVAVLAPDGCVLLMEIKAGDVILRGGEIFKVYTDGECDVGRQSLTQRAALHNRLIQARLKTPLLSCLVLPDYTLGDTQIHPRADGGHHGAVRGRRALPDGGDGGQRTGMIRGYPGNRVRRARHCARHTPAASH